MLVSRVLSRIPKTALAQCRTSSLLVSTTKQNQCFSIISSQFHSLHESPNKLAPWQASLLNHSTLGSDFQRCGISSSASPEPNEKETSHTGSEHGSKVESRGAATNAEADQTEVVSSADATAPDQTKESGSTSESQTQSVNRRRGGAKRTAFSDSDSDSSSSSDEEMSVDDLVKLVAEKEELLKIKHKEIETMKDKVLRTYAEMENVMDRTRREAENSKKFAIQNFAKSLLDVADNLGRASAIVKDSFSKLDVSVDTAGAVPLLKTLLEGVDMTDKQLAEVFKKFGVEKYDPINEQFDPHRHNAQFQMPDATKPPGTVAAVLKPGYMLYDRVIRPAEVGVTQAVEDNEAEGSEA